MALAGAIARGQDFLGYNVLKARRVLIIDGELPLEDLQERYQLMFSNNPPALLNVLSSQRLWEAGETPLTINEPETQERIDRLLDDMEEAGRLPEVLALDNYSSLTYGLDENSNSELDSILRWLIQLRHRGITVLAVHHAGRSGDQRGATRREDLLDVSVKLVEIDREANPGITGAACTMSFSKLRGERPNPDQLDLRLEQDAAGLLTWSFSEGKEKKDRVLDVMRALIEADKAGKPIDDYTAVGNAIGVSRPTATKYVKAARKKGYLRNWVIQVKGRNTVAADDDDF